MFDSIFLYQSSSSTSIVSNTPIELCIIRNDKMKWLRKIELEFFHTFNLCRQNYWYLVDKLIENDCNSNNNPWLTLWNKQVMVHEGIHWWTDYKTVTDFDLFSNEICPLLLNSDALKTFLKLFLIFMFS